MKKNSRLKIAHIDFGFNWPVKGGEQLRVHNVTDRLAKLDFDINLFVPSFRRKEILNFNAIPIKFFYCPENISLRKKIFPKHNKIFKDVFNLVREFKPDIIHNHFGTMKYLVNSIIASNKLKVLQVVTFHQFWPLCYRGIYWDFEGNVCEKRDVCGECALTVPLMDKVMNMKWRKTVKWILGSIDHFITYSEYMKKKLAEAGVKNEKITVIPFGADFENVSSRRCKRKYIIFSGRLSREKGVDLFIKAISNLRKDSFKAVVIGDGPQMEEYEKFTKEKKVNITFTGWINAREKYFQYLTKAICVVVPSVWIENSPLVIGEAFASETPVIGTNSGGIPELINDSGAGFVVKRNPNEIAEKITILINNPKLREEMGKKGRDYAEKHFNWEKNVEKLIDVYEKVLSERKK